MTEQELTQARADVDQLDIEQLRCGVMLQLLKIEALKKERGALEVRIGALIVERSDAFFKVIQERDEWLARHAECCRLMGECMQDRADMATERDTLALEVDQWRVDYNELLIERDALMSAAKLALEALVKVRGMHYTAVIPAEKAIEALRQAGVQ